jgi:arabinofuranan 3-O-arabinosyltransferase
VLDPPPVVVASPHAIHTHPRPLFQRRPVEEAPFVVRPMRRHPIGAAIASASTLVGLVVAFAWFRIGRFYAHGDLTPWIRTSLRSEIGAQWTHQDTGAGGPTYEIVRWIELAFIDFAHVLGGTETLAQRLFFAVLFAAAASGAAAVAARFTRRAVLIFAAGVIGAFNPLIMINLPNYLIALLVALVGWTAALAIDAASGKRRTRPRLFALILLGASYLSLNPPLLAVLVFWLFALPVFATLMTSTGRAGARRSLRFLAVAAAWSIPLALWWVVPYLYAIRDAAASGTIGADTNVFTWSWTQAHSSLDRVLALVAKWSWPDPRFGWSASRLGAPGWLWIAFLLPIGALLAPLVCRPKRQRAALWFVALTMTTALIAKGLNGPLHGFNAVLYRDVPGMFLLREPMSKVGGLIVLGLIGAWVLTIDGLLARARVMRWRGAPMAPVAACGAIAMIAAPVVFAWPMLSGTVVQSRERVAVPAGWRQVARLVDDGPLPGKTLILPLDDLYQIPTTWGYYGDDIVTTQLFTRPTIMRRPQEYIGDPAGFAQLRDSVETSLVARDPVSAAGALRALGVSYIVVRNDIDYNSPIRSVSVAHPGSIEQGLEQTDGIRLVAANSIANVYEFANGAPPVEALTGTIGAAGASPDALASLASAAPRGTAILSNGPGSQPTVRGESWSIDVNQGGTISPPAAGDWRYQLQPNGVPVMELRPDPRGLVLHDPVAINIGGGLVADPADMVVTGRGPAVAASIDGKLFDLSSSNAFARVESGAAVKAFGAGTVGSIGAWSNVQDCNNYDAAPPGSIAADMIVTPDGQQAIRLRARRHSACVSAPLVGIKVGDVVRLSIEERAVRGARPRMCLWEPGRQQCAALQWSAKPQGMWFALTAVARVPQNAGSMAMYLYTDQPAKGSGAWSENWYRNVTVKTLVPGTTTVVPASSAPAGTLRLAGRPVSVSTTFDAPTPLIGARSDASDCNQHGHRSLAALGIQAVTFRADDPTAVSLSARDDSACVSMPVFGLQRSLDYELSLDAQVLAGARPRVCLWELPIGRCASLQPASSSSSTPTSGPLVLRGRASADATSWRLFLYADATGHGTTIEYSNIKMRVIADDALVLRPASVSAPTPPALTWRRISSSRYQVQVRDAQGPFVLALTDAYAAGWHLGGLPSGAHVSHVELDGYRNAWAIDGRGDMHLSVVYAPARAGLDARRISELTLVALLATATFPLLRRLRRQHSQLRLRRVLRTGPRRVELPAGWHSTANDAGSDGRGHEPTLSL